MPAENKSVTKNFVTRRINAVLDTLGKTLEAEERKLIADNTLSLANDHPRYVSPADAPAAERITSEDLAAALIKAHFVDQSIDLSATDINPKEYLDIAKAAIQQEKAEDARRRGWAQQSRQPTGPQHNLREIRVGDLGLPKGFTLE